MSKLRLASPADEGLILPSYLDKALALYEQRRRRAAIFAEVPTAFQEPAWDILLDLFIAHERSRPTSVSSACIAACVPSTTALRWLTYLERQNLVRRWEHENDGRAKLVGLTPKGMEMMLRYLDGV